MSKEYLDEEARSLMILTGAADYIINIVERDIESMINDNEDEYPSSRHVNRRIGVWSIEDTINLSDQEGLTICLHIQEYVMEKAMTIKYSKDVWSIRGSGDISKNLSEFAERCRKCSLSFHTPDPDTKIYKSIYKGAVIVKEDKKDYSVSSIHPSHAETCDEYNPKESLALINEAGFNMALMCMIMNTYDSKFASKEWQFKNDQISIFVHQNELFVALIFSHPDTDEDGITENEADMVINIFKQNSDIDIVSYVSDPKNYLVSVRSMLEDAGVVDPVQFSYFVKLFKEV